MMMACKMSVCNVHSVEKTEHHIEINMHIYSIGFHIRQFLKRFTWQRECCHVEAEKRTRLKTHRRRRRADGSIANEPFI